MSYWTKGSSLGDDERLAWLRLIRSDGVGPRTFRGLVDRFGSPVAALDALPRLHREGGRALHVCTREEAQAEFEACAKQGIVFVAITEKSYPLALAATADAPPLIALRGDPAVLARPMVGIVGSRNASALGLRFAERLARELGEAGFTIVSGLARGIDARAHGASLASGTVAVLAGGHEHIYPNENRPLLERIVENGAALSEMPLTWEPRGRDFPRRNRIVSGLSHGVIVIEAARGSGSLITARFALEQGREVFAVPGNITSKMSWGPNLLIKAGGAKLVQEWSDVTDELPAAIRRELVVRAQQQLLPGEGDAVLAASAGPEEPLKALARKLLNCLQVDVPKQFESLVESFQEVSSSELIGALFDLEMSGLVRQLPGKNFVKVW